MAAQQVPSVGRIVHYVLPTGPKQGQHRPAIIVRVWESESHPHGHPDNLVQLHVFLDGSNDTHNYFADHTPASHWATSVRQDPTGTQFGTYHWPEPVPPVDLDAGNA